LLKSCVGANLHHCDIGAKMEVILAFLAIIMQGGEPNFRG
jgi:hypothetical protein